MSPSLRTEHPATGSRDDVTAAVFDGFFPAVPYTADPIRTKAGLQEMGLPYVSDPAVTKHLSAFLRKHLPPGEVPDAILFNGGVFQPASLRDRLLTVMADWFGPTWTPLVLTSPSLDLAVAWGAAWFAWLKHAGGKRIGAAIAIELARNGVDVGLSYNRSRGEAEQTAGIVRALGRTCELVQVDLSRLELPVLTANEQEAAAHDAVLADIDKACKGKTLWRQLAPAV